MRTEKSGKRRRRSKRRGIPIALLSRAIGPTSGPPDFRVESALAIKKAAVSATTNTTSKRIRLRQPMPVPAARNETGPNGFGLSGTGCAGCNGAWLEGRAHRVPVVLGDLDRSFDVASFHERFVRSVCTRLLRADRTELTVPKAIEGLIGSSIPAMLVCCGFEIRPEDRGLAGLSAGRFASGASNASANPLVRSGRILLGFGRRIALLSEQERQDISSVRKGNSPDE